jgi:hypothetical protein
VDKKSHLFRFKLKAEPEVALFDPDHWILKKVDFPKTEAMWVRQLTQDPHVLGRVDAAKALAKMGSPAVVRPFWPRPSSRKNSGTCKGKWPKRWARFGRRPRPGRSCTPIPVRSTHPKARRAILYALGEFRETVRCGTGCWQRIEEEKSYFAFNQAVRALARQGDPSALAVIEKAH